ncbi:MAG: hypothetical protein ACYCYG_14095, partial [Bellilinea sp.]
MDQPTDKALKRSLIAQADAKLLGTSGFIQTSNMILAKKLWARIRNTSPAQVVPYALMIVAIVLWLYSLSVVDLTKMDDLGLVSALPNGVFISLGLLTLSFSLVITSRSFSPTLVFAHIALLVFMLYGITAIVEEVPRFGPSWRHAGVIEYIMRNESVNPRIDAYFNWPGFFIMGALVTQIAGLSSAVPFLSWAPVFFELIYMGPLFIIYSSLTDSKRLVWLGIWIFYITNWVGQDYFSPQGLNFFFFLVVLAVLIRWFRPSTIMKQWFSGSKILNKFPKINRFFEMMFTREVGASSSINLSQKAFFLLMIMLIYFVSIASHQLTQFAILISIVFLLLFQRITPRLLPVIMLILSGIWIGYMASAYMAGRLASMLAVFGRLDTALDSNLMNRMSGSPDHLLVTQIRMVFTLGVWLAAFMGFIRRWIRGSMEMSAILLMAAPFPLLIMQTYGGEMLMRIFLFSLPLAAYLSASLIFPLKSDPPSWRYTIVIGAISAILIGAFWFTRYGNERMEYFTPSEVAGIEYLYEQSEPGSLVATVSTNLPYKSINYEKYRYVRLEDRIVYNDIVAVLQTMNNSRFTHTYFLLTRSQKAYVEMFYGHGKVDWDMLEKTLLASPTAIMIYQNDD